MNKITLYDDDMRTIVEIPDEQIAALSKICRQKGISRAEAIRRAIHVFTRSVHISKNRDAFGLWKNRKINGLKYEDQVRDDWSQRTKP